MATKPATKKAKQEGFPRRAQIRFIRAVAVFLSECPAAMRAELRGVLKEIDEMQKDRKTYRAAFQGYKPNAVQLAMTVAAEVTIEVFAQTKDRWAARFWPSTNLMRSVSAQSREGAEAQVEHAFTTQTVEWTAFNPDGSAYVEPDPEEAAQ